MSTQSQHILNFDLPAAHQAKLDGMARVETKANPEWLRQMVAVGGQVARVKRELTTDDIVREYVKDPSRPTTTNMRAMSAVMKKLQDMGIIEITDRFVNSERVKQHRCPIRIWLSTVCR